MNLRRVGLRVSGLALRSLNNSEHMGGSLK